MKRTNEYGLRDDTMEAVTDAVYSLANAYINPIYDGDNDPIDLAVAVDYCYREFEEIIRMVSGYTTACRFDSKRKILKAIEYEIQSNEYIILKK